MNNFASRIVLAFFILTCMAGCHDTKSLPGNYKLERWEDTTTYYLLGPTANSENTGSGGAIDGVVMRLAWNDEIIAAERYANFRDDPDGWMIIDVKAEKISGPVTQSEFDAIRIKHHLKVMLARQAWSAL